MKTFLPTDSKRAVETVVGELVRMRKSFTGKDVFDRMYNKRIRRKENFSLCVGGEKDVSMYVRYLFNKGTYPFREYGSSIVPHSAGNGPVLYFPLPYHAKLKASRISGVLSGIDHDG